MSEKRFEVVLNEFDEVEYIMDKEMMEDRDFAEFMDFVELMARNQSALAKENEQLRKENQEYKAVLQDMGLTRSEEEVRRIRKELANAIIKPICKSNGYDVDVDVTDGIIIIPKEEEQE